MKYSKSLAPVLALGLVLAMPTVVPAADPPPPGVIVNGLPLFGAVSGLKASVELVEYRDGSNPNVIRLIPGAKRFDVCIHSRGPVKMLDAELPVAATPDRFTVQIEDGRTFSECLVSEVIRKKTDPRERVHDVRPKVPYKYCLRCEDVTTPVSIP